MYRYKILQCTYKIVDLDLQNYKLRKPLSKKVILKGNANQKIFLFVMFQLSNTMINNL